MFLEHPECTAEEWQLFKGAVASSDAWVCGRKRLGVAINGEKITSRGSMK